MLDKIKHFFIFINYFYYYEFIIGARPEREAGNLEKGRREMGPCAAGNM